jgi:predicted amidohydrolase YtcJ
VRHRSMIVATGISLSLCLLAGFFAEAAAQEAQSADAVFINGKVFTANPGSEIVEAFAVKDDRFIAVGSSAEIRRYAGHETNVIDLDGRLVVPGLADGHLHNEGGGPGVDLSQVRTLADLFSAISAAAKAANPGDLIVSNADWHEAQLKEKRLPLAKEIDAAAPENPVVLVRGGHEMILNTSALRKFNITRDTKSPDGGVISKGADGEPTGEIFDNAKQLVQVPRPKPVSIDDVLATQKRLNPYGVTAVRIPGAYKGNMLDDYKLIREAREKGLLTLRYSILLPGFGTRDPAKIRQLIDAWGVKQDEGDDWVRIGGIKLLVDGGFEGGHMSHPYEEPYGEGGKYAGLTVVPPADFTAVVKAANSLGWRVTTHAVGDAALDEVLDAYEAANAERPIAGERWAVEHAFLAGPSEIERMKKLGLMLSVQDHLYLAAPAMEKYWGRVRADRVTPLKTYLDSGFLVVGGTDSPVVPFNPFWEIYNFLTRDTIAGGVYGPAERVTSRPMLLRMITINYAKLIGEEQTKGSIELGKLADFAILSQDILTVPVDEIRNTKAVATYVGGKQVYRDPAFR